MNTESCLITCRLPDETLIDVIANCQEAEEELGLSQYILPSSRYQKLDSSKSAIRHLQDRCKTATRPLFLASKAHQTFTSGRYEGKKFKTQSCDGLSRKEACGLSIQEIFLSYDDCIQMMKNDLEEICPKKAFLENLSLSDTPLKETAKCYPFEQKYFDEKGKLVVLNRFIIPIEYFKKYLQNTPALEGKELLRETVKENFALDCQVYKGRADVYLLIRNKDGNFLFIDNEERRISEIGIGGYGTISPDYIIELCERYLDTKYYPTIPQKVRERINPSIQNEQERQALPINPELGKSYLDCFTEFTKGVQMLSTETLGSALMIIAYARSNNDSQDSHLNRLYQFLKYTEIVCKHLSENPDQTDQYLAILEECLRNLKSGLPPLLETEAEEPKLTANQKKRRRKKKNQQIQPKELEFHHKVVDFFTNLFKQDKEPKMEMLMQLFTRPLISIFDHFTNDLGPIYAIKNSLIVKSQYLAAMINIYMETVYLSSPEETIRQLQKICKTLEEFNKELKEEHFDNALEILEQLNDLAFIKESKDFFKASSENVLSQDQFNNLHLIQQILHLQGILKFLISGSLSKEYDLQQSGSLIKDVDSHQSESAAKKVDSQQDKSLTMKPDSTFWRSQLAEIYQNGTFELTEEEEGCLCSQIGAQILLNPRKLDGGFIFDASETKMVVGKQHPISRDHVVEEKEVHLFPDLEEKGLEMEAQQAVKRYREEHSKENTRP